MARRISEDLISEIINSNDIIDYASRFVSLKRTGRDFVGLCPFHHEKTPSFHINADKQLYHCFGCGASGNLVRLVMSMENLDFIDSIKVLAERAGIRIPEDSIVSDGDHSKRKRVLEMNKEAARFFHGCFKDKRIGAEAQNYFLQRHILAKTITVYGLGYAPNSKNALLNFLKEKGFSEAEIVEGGLAIERDGRIIDKFRNRVMFPIINVRGEIIGFGGRIMHNNKEINGYKIPKYLNSSETIAFDKGKNLFSLNLAKNKRTDELILCEGYMDVISVYQSGTVNVVATLGTAITPEQAKLMLRYAGEILICYDSDEAGITAALRAIDIISDAGGKSRVIKLKGAKDPDEYINKNGAEGFRRAMKNAVPSVEFKLSLIRGKYDTSTTDGKVRFLEEAVDVFLKIRDPIETDAYITKIASEMDVSKDAILSKCKGKSAKSSYNNRQYPKIKRERPAVVLREDGTKQKIPTAMTEAEKRLLSLIVGNKKYYNAAKNEISPEDFSKDIHIRLAKKIYESYQNGQNPQESIILNDFCGTDEDINEASAVFYNMEIYNGDTDVIYDLINTIKLNKIQLMIDNETDITRIKELLDKKQQLVKSKTSSGRNNDAGKEKGN